MVTTLLAGSDSSGVSGLRPRNELSALRPDGHGRQRGDGGPLEDLAGAGVEDAAVAGAADLSVLDGVHDTAPVGADRAERRVPVLGGPGDDHPVLTVDLRAAGRDGVGRAEVDGGGGSRGRLLARSLR